MRTIILLIASTLIFTQAAETPTAKPAPTAAAKTPPVVKPAPKSITFSREDNLVIENIQLRTDALNKSLGDIFGKYCIEIGGKTVNDCTPIQPSQASPGWSVQLKTQAPPKAPAEVPAAAAPAN